MSANEITTKARDYRELQAMIKELEAEAEALKAAIIAEMDLRGTDTLQADIFTVSYKAYTTHRIDTNAIKQELPELAARYTKTAEARRFQVA